MEKMPYQYLMCEWHKRFSEGREDVEDNDLAVQ
jgi:hypothetical protein